MTPTNMNAILSSKKVRSTPGDTLRVLTRAAVDALGRIWPAGTEFRPQSLGRGGQVVIIRGENVRFPEPASAHDPEARS